eukprot:420240-Amphidinium_carterae.1
MVDPHCASCAPQVHVECPHGLLAGLCSHNKPALNLLQIHNGTTETLRYVGGVSQRHRNEPNMRGIVCKLFV